MRRHPIVAGLFAFSCSFWFNGWAGAEPISFDGHKVVHVKVSTEQEAARLQASGLDIWSCSAHAHIGLIPVRVAPDEVQKLDSLGLPSTTWIADLGPLAVSQRQQLRGATFHQSYHTLAEIETEVQQLAIAHSAIAQTLSFGTSLENRDLMGIRITGPGNGPDKPGIFIHGGQHAREWIGPAVMMYVIDWLLTNYGTDPRATQLVDDLEWFILPVMNPDGYEFSWTDERFWRKNRRDNPDGSFGVDLNRNWGHQWGGEGSSGIMSDLAYRGPSPFSEPETQAMRDFIWAHPNITGYIDFHSFSELILWPWGWTSDLCDDNDEFDHLGSGMHDAILATHGHSYDYGPIYTTIYPASGGSADWVYGANVPSRFIAGMSIELRDQGEFGFVLPPGQIIPTSEENLQAILFMAEVISEPLRVDLVSQVPATMAPGQSLLVTAEVVPRAQSVAANGVAVNYRTDGGPFSVQTLSPVGGDLYSATLPPVDCGDQLDFYVVALGDGGGTVAYPEQAPTDLVSVPVGVTFTHLTDNLETVTGWTVGSAGDSATTGIWVRVDPVASAAQPEDDYTADPGTMCFVTGQGNPGGAVGVNDVDGGETTLSSPVFDVPLDTFTVSYALWFYTSFPNGSSNDWMEVSVSNNNGNTWTPVETITAPTNGWSIRSFRPVDLGIAATAQMKLRFSAADNNPGSIVEAGIDELIISKFGCPDGDYDGDLDVSLSDYPGLSGCMNGPAGASVSAACGVFNFDVDTDVDMNDYLDFMLRFGT